MTSPHDADLIEGLGDLFTDCAETILYTPSGGAQTSIEALVDRAGTDDEDRASRKDAVHRATLHVLVSDVPEPKHGDTATFDLYEEGGSNSAKWALETPGDIAAGLAVAEMIYDSTREQRRQGHRGE